MNKVNLKQIENFLHTKTFALYGISKVKQKFGNTLAKELSQTGLIIYPIHREIKTIEGLKCYQNLTEIPERIESAIVCTKKENTDKILEELKEFGIKNVWLQQGSSSMEIVEKAQKEFTNIIFDKCIFMFAKPIGIHRFHARILSFFGKYPK